MSDQNIAKRGWRHQVPEGHNPLKTWTALEHPATTWKVGRRRKRNKVAHALSNVLRASTAGWVEQCGGTATALLSSIRVGCVTRGEDEPRVEAFPRRTGHPGGDPPLGIPSDP